MLRLWVLLPLLHVSCAAVRLLPEEVRIAITASAAVSRNDHVIDVASPGLVLGQACAAGDGACWVVQKKAANPELCGDDGRSLASCNSLLLLSHYGGAVSYANYPNLMSVSVLAAMHMVDPNSFFFACPAADGKLQAQTETLLFASTGGGFELPGNVGGGHHSFGCNVKELVLVLRRSGLQLALYHALGVCAALKVELVLGPLQRGLSAFQLALQRGITDFWHPDGTRATIAPGLRAAATQLESAADDTEAAGRGDQRLKANVEEARRMARVVRELFDGSAGSPIYVTTPVVADASAGAGSPTADDEDGDIDLSCGDRVIPSNFYSGMRVRDAVFGLGRVLEVGPAASGQPHSGQVRIEYDDQGPTHGQPTPLWRTVDGGLIREAEGREADPSAGIRVRGGA